jgi:hypothetical protein
MDSLGEGKPGDELQIDALRGMSSVDGCSLGAVVGGADLGVEPAPSRAWFRRCRYPYGCLAQDTPDSRLAACAKGPAPVTDERRYHRALANALSRPRLYTMRSDQQTYARRRPRYSRRTQVLFGVGIVGTYGTTLLPLIGWASTIVAAVFCALTLGGLWSGYRENRALFQQAVNTRTFVVTLGVAGALFAAICVLVATRV